MSKIFTKLNLGDVVYSSGGKCFKRLSTEVGADVKSGNFISFSSPSAFTLQSKTNTTSGVTPEKTWNGTIEYSTDANTWNVWDGVTILSADNGCLYLRGAGNTYLTVNSQSRVYGWQLSGANVSCKGNIETLLDYATVANGGHPTMGSSCYQELFALCEALITAPELPSTSLSSSCYNQMFLKCKNLATLPKLPATTLASSCYYNMFSGCDKIALSSTQTDAHQTPYRIPTSGTGAGGNTYSLKNMFNNTGGTFTGTPTINTTYYTSNTVV